jgi:hypothetical protein
MSLCLQHAARWKHVLSGDTSTPDVIKHVKHVNHKPFPHGLPGLPGDPPQPRERYSQVQVHQVVVRHSPSVYPRITPRKQKIWKICKTSIL